MPFRAFKRSRPSSFNYARIRPRVASFRKRIQKRKKFLPHSQVIRNRLITPVTYVKMKYTPMLAGTTQPYRELIAMGLANDFGEYCMSGNSTYDPDVTSTGGVCTGHDQWYGFYAIGTVVASKIKVTFINSDAQAHFKVGVVPTQATTWDPATETPPDWPGAKSAVVDSIHAKSMVTVENFYRTNTIFGVSAQQVRDESNYGQLITTNPVNRWYWLLYAIPADSHGSNGNVITAMIEVTYYVRMCDRIELPIS